MATRRSLTRLINKAVSSQPLHKQFLTDLMMAIEMDNNKGTRPSSKMYKPSSFVCLRQMYYMRAGFPKDGRRTEYNGVGMADTGTQRHASIQRVLLKMKEFGFDWEYLDVEEYLAEKWAEQKCLNITIKGKRGAETHLVDTVLGISFMCDGIIRHIPTGRCFLFEFKNQISFKYQGKVKLDTEHEPQVECYCTCLDLEDVFVVYENRDNCELECVTYHVNQEMRDAVVGKLVECEEYVRRLVAPPKHPDTKPCRWCDYQTPCKKAGN